MSNPRSTDPGDAPSRGPVIIRSPGPTTTPLIRTSSVRNPSRSGTSFCVRSLRADRRIGGAAIERRRPRLALWLLGPELAQRDNYWLWHEVGHVMAESRDFANSGGSHEYEPQIAHQVGLLDLRRHVLVHERLIEFGREVVHCSEASHDGFGVSAPNKVSEQAVERLHINRCHVLNTRREHGDPLLRREERLVRWCVIHRDDHSIEDPRRSAHDVEMSVRHWVKPAGIYGDHSNSVPGRRRRLPTRLAECPRVSLTLAIRRRGVRNDGTVRRSVATECSASSDPRGRLRRGCRRCHRTRRGPVAADYWPSTRVS